MGKVDILLLSEKETEAVGISWSEAIDAVENVLKAHGLGRVVVPAKINVDTNITGEFQALGNAMPAFIEYLKIYGIKWITWNFDNPKQGLPGIMATIQLNDPHTGAPVAIMGGSWITAMRTGAVGAIVYKYLGKRDARNLAIIGAGTQGRYQLAALKEVMKIDEVRIYDISEAARASFVKEMSGTHSLKITATNSMQEAVTNADVVVTVTTANEPLVKAQWLKEKGTLMISIGSYQEFDFLSIKRANKIVVDHLEQTLHRGELAKWVQKGMLGEKDIYGTLGDIISGKKPGRENDEENIFCVPIGMGCDDIAIAYKIWEKAKAGNLGRIFPWL